MQINTHTSWDIEQNNWMKIHCKCSLWEESDWILSTTVSVRHDMNTESLLPHYSSIQKCRREERSNHMNNCYNCIINLWTLFETMKIITICQSVAALIKMIFDSNERNGLLF